MTHKQAGIDQCEQHNVYVSPRTRAPLYIEGSQLRTFSADEVFPVIAGIPQFLRFTPAEDAETQAKLERLNDSARHNGWQEALKSVYGLNAPIVRYVTDQVRTSFIDLLPLSPDSDVLEIGPGLGQFTTSLARRSRSVWALEVVAGQAQFAAERCTQDGSRNVNIAVGGDDCRLPYADGRFDVAVLNLVLEWCASRCPGEPIVDVQRRLLSEIWRVLRPGGALYMATKNRFALHLLIGKADEHCYGLRFGSALPRWIANQLMRTKGHDRPFGMLHSYNGLKVLLSAIGFEGIESYWAAPEMRFPTHHIPTDNASIRRALRDPRFPRGELRSTKLLMSVVPIPIVKHVTPGLSFLARRGREQPSEMGPA